MAWITVVPPSPRHPYEGYQVCYQQGKRKRSPGIFLTKRRTLAEQRALERGRRDELAVAGEVDVEKARTLLGEYVTAKWWPAWKDQHPTSAYGTKKIEKRILPTFGDLPLAQLDASTIGRGRRRWPPSGCRPRPSTPTCRCLAPSSTPQSTTCPARRCCAERRRRTASPASSPSPDARCGWPASRWAGWSRRSTSTTARWCWSPRSC